MIKPSATAVIFYKVLAADGSACHGGRGRWHLPDGNGPGGWMPRIPDPEPCRRGYHLCRDITDLLLWLGPTIYLAEAAGTIVPGGGKVVAETARLLRRLPWDERRARLFAIDCTERVLPIFERGRPGDDRPRRAIDAARRYVAGEINSHGLDAAREAAWDAARTIKDVAWVRDAAWAAGDAATSGDAGVTIWDAAREAARDAARATGATTAVWDAERDWQAARLAHYLNSEMIP